MTGSIPVPAKGQPIKASWAAAVSERVNALCGMAPSGMLARDGVGGIGAQPLPANRREQHRCHLHPFTVRWAQSANDGDGAWIIWLPGDGLVSIAGTAYDPSDDLDAVGGDYPAGWYTLIVDGDDLIDPEAGGTLWLNITESGSSYVVEFADDTLGSGVDGASVAICEASVDSTTGERKVKQFVTSAIVLGGVGDDTDTDTQYGCDERSISLLGNESSDPTQNFHTPYFHIYGFGKFSATGYTNPIGTYSPPTDLTITEEASDVAVLVRSGNSSQANANFLEYRRLKIAAVAASPFQYVKGVDTSGQTPVDTHTIINCKFYWDGVLQSLNDYDCSSVVAQGGTVYLRGTQAAPSAQSPNPAWAWTIGNATQSASQGGKALNYKLYDFANSKVSLDYRTTFLALEDHTQKAKMVIAAPGDGPAIVLDSTELESGEEIAVHNLTVNGDDSAGVKILATDDVDVGMKTLVEGDNVTLTESPDGKSITISAELEGSSSTSGFTGSRTVLLDVKYESYKLWKKFATETWEDGVLKTSVEGDWEEYHTAVEETT